MPFLNVIHLATIFGGKQRLLTVTVSYLSWFVCLYVEENGQSQPTADSSHHDEGFVPKSLVDCLRR